MDSFHLALIRCTEYGYLLTLYKWCLFGVARMKHIFILASFAWCIIQSPIREWECSPENLPVFCTRSHHDTTDTSDTIDTNDTSDTNLVGFALAGET